MLLTTSIRMQNRSAIAHYPSCLGVREPHRIEIVVRLLKLRPGGAAVGRTENHSRVAHGRARVGICEKDSVEMSVCPAGLGRPSRAPISGAQNGSKIADCSPDVGVDKGDSVERIRRSALLGRPGCAAIVVCRMGAACGNVVGQPTAHPLLLSAKTSA